MTDEPSQALSIEVERQRRRLGVADDARCRACGLCARARRRRRHAAPVHGGGGRAAWPSAASPRCASSSRRWSARRAGPIRRASPTRRCAPRSPKRTRRLGGSAAVRRRQVVRRPDDVAGAGRSAAARRRAAWSSSASRFTRAGRPGDERGEHLARVACPMLFVQGTRDDLADVGLITALTHRLGARDAGDVRRCRSRLSCAGAAAAATTPRCSAHLLDTMRRMDGARRRRPFARAARPEPGRRDYGLPSWTRRRPWPPLRTRLRPACLAA